MHPFAKTRKTFKTAPGKSAALWSLPALARQYPGIKRLPHSIRIVLESVLRHCDGQKVTEDHVRQLAQWAANAPRTEEIPFVVARVVRDVSAGAGRRDGDRFRRVPGAQDKPQPWVAYQSHQNLQPR